MKAVLMSIRPQWCELIASDRKTLEVRKTKPKLETPFKVYIYCTSGKLLFYSNICGYDMEDYRKDYMANRKVIGEFVCDKVFLWNRDIHDEDTITLEDACEMSCMTEDALLKYADGYFYAWHISDLVIYDKPKPLGEFYKECAGLYDIGMCYECEKAFGEECDCTVNGCLRFTRPPQSWCYVEELKNG